MKILNFHLWRCSRLWITLIILLLLKIPTLWPKINKFWSDSSKNSMKKCKSEGNKEKLKNKRIKMMIDLIWNSLDSPKIKFLLLWNMSTLPSSLWLSLAVLLTSCPSLTILRALRNLPAKRRKLHQAKVCHLPRPPRNNDSIDCLYFIFILFHFQKQRQKDNAIVGIYLSFLLITWKIHRKLMCLIFD